MSHGIFRHRNGFAASFSLVDCILYTSFKQGVPSKGGEGKLCSYCDYVQGSPLFYVMLDVVQQRRHRWWMDMATRTRYRVYILTYY